jgi:GNAT superfamily N-acetyltransferase
VTIEYKVNAPIDAAQFIDLLERSGLAERRPIGDIACIEGILANSNLVLTAWDASRLIGVARSVTDFHYACYLSDLAVCKLYQKQGVGRQLQALTQRQLGPRCKLILIAAPAANA